MRRRHAGEPRALDLRELVGAQALLVDAATCTSFAPAAFSAEREAGVVRLLEHDAVARVDEQSRR